MIGISVANTVLRMPAKPLSEEQQRDAVRLRQAYDLWTASRRESGLPSTQDQVAELFDMGQSALSQYLTAKIPLNAEALHRFCTVMGIRASNISPSIVRQQRELVTALEAEPDEAPPPAPNSGAGASRYFKPPPLPKSNKPRGT